MQNPWLERTPGQGAECFRRDFSAAFLSSLGFPASFDFPAGKLKQAGVVINGLSRSGSDPQVVWIIFHFFLEVSER